MKTHRIYILLMIALLGTNLNLSSQTYTMPAEDLPHEGTWLQWPHHYTYGMFYRNSLDPTWVNITAALVQSEKVHIIAYNNTEKTRIINLLNNTGVPLTNVDFYIHPTDDVWVRDNGPVFTYNNNDVFTILDWGFNGWGGDTPYLKCDIIPHSVSTDLSITRVDLSAMVLEGGAVEHDGRGTMMATRSSVTDPSRNPSLTEAQIEAYLSTYMGFTKFIWLDGLDGGNEDITDIHIDGLMKFANENTIVTMNNTDLLYWLLTQSDINTLYSASDINQTPYNFVYIPLTQNDVTTAYGNNLGYKGSYANYYIANTVVLVPTYNDPNDATALSILQGLYPNRTVIGIDVRNLYENGGMVHCVTQQQPVAQRNLYWKGETGDWNDANNWAFDNGDTHIPSLLNNVVIADAANAPVILVNETGNCNKLTLQSGATLTIKSSPSGTGSLIVNGTVAGDITVERYIAAYSDPAHGWHFLSSPVAAFNIAGSDFEPGDNDDFYRWDEPSGNWMNFKSGNPNQIIPGAGYFTAYQTESTKQFSGILNSSDIVNTNLSYTQTSAYTGWHLLGNPFACALQWDATSWDRTNVNAIAKIWNEANASYTDISKNDIIPAMQGFMVCVTSGANSITIPKVDRVHSTANWYKNTEINKLELTVFDAEGSTAQASVIKFDENATAGFDNEYDAYFLSGYAPQFYSLIDEKAVSTNTFQDWNEQLSIPLYFIKNDATVFTMTIDGLETLEIESPVFLTDTKTNETINFEELDFYTFESEEGDDPARFMLHFMATDISEEANVSTPEFFFQNKWLNITNLEAGKTEVRVVDIMGRVVAMKTVNTSSNLLIPLNLKTGIYILEIKNNYYSFVSKIFVR